jgi:NAD(P)-dependent dehydrogenase (short-subunit alcohol dehydrogenase family)
MSGQAAERKAATTGKSLSEQVVVVTGAASGIGRETARAFCRNGARIVALDINEQGLAALNDELDCRTYPCDVTDTQSVDAVFRSIDDSGLTIDILVSNAGAAHQGPIGDVPADELRRSFDLNFFGHQNVCQAALRLFRKQGEGGTFLFNISNQSINPGKHFGPYGIPKAATLALMKQYALDHAADGVRANGVNAGRIRSELMTDRMIEERAAARGVTPDQYMSGNLLGLEVFASDVADAFVHLALMDKVNATVLTVDGGAMATSLR